MNLGNGPIAQEGIKRLLMETEEQRGFWGKAFLKSRSRGLKTSTRFVFLNELGYIDDGRLL